MKTKRLYRIISFTFVLLFMIVNIVSAKTDDNKIYTTNGGSATIELSDFDNELFPVDRVSEIKEIKTLANINRNGDMEVKQRWIFDDSISKDTTEHYIVFSKAGLSKVKIRDIKVLHNNKLMEGTDKWDVDADFEDKAGKFGINTTSDNIEICFGITDRVGNNVFEVEYTIEKALYKTSDNYVFLNWQFINDNLSSPVDKSRIEVKFPSKIKKMYGFGYEGVVALSNSYRDTVVFETITEPGLNSSKRMISLVEIENTGLDNLREEDITREDTYKRSFKGSSYSIDNINDSYKLLNETEVKAAYDRGEDSVVTHTSDSQSSPRSLSYIMHYVVILAIFIVWAVVGYKSFNKKRIYTNIDAKELKHLMWRDKIEVDPEEFLYILDQEDLTSMVNLVMYYITKWVKENRIEVSSDEIPLIFGIKTSRITIKFNGYCRPERTLEGTIYDFLYDKTNEDEILSEKALKYINWSEVEEEYLDYVRSDECEVNASNYYYMDNKKKIMNDEGTSILKKYYGIRNFLVEYTLMDEREIQEVKLWDYHLEYAALFGIADRVQKQLQLYPETYQNTVGGYLTYNSFVALNTGVYRTVSHAVSSSGSGGGSSTGGGGGSSGGGSGGGSR